MSCIYSVSNNIGTFALHITFDLVQNILVLRVSLLKMLMELGHSSEVLHTYWAEEPLTDRGLIHVKQGCNVTSWMGRWFLV